jgi:hypothetical protein
LALDGKCLREVFVRLGTCEIGHEGSPLCLFAGVSQLARYVVRLGGNNSCNTEFTPGRTSHEYDPHAGVLRDSSKHHLTIYGGRHGPAAVLSESHAG